jgi:hypothetical protein
VRRLGGCRVRGYLLKVIGEEGEGKTSNIEHSMSIIEYGS